MTKTAVIPEPLLGIFQSPAVAQIANELASRGTAAATGQWGSCALVLAAAVRAKLQRPVLIITGHLDEADDAIDQLTFFDRGSRPQLFPAYEVLPGETNTSQELSAQRLGLLADLASGVIPPIITTPIQAIMQPCPNRDLLKDQIVTLKTGESQNRDTLTGWLAQQGYTRLETVENPGDFAVRGEILDIWPAGETRPLRLNFFGDEIESIHGFDVETLGTLDALTSLRVAATGSSSTWPREQTVSLLAWLPKETIIWLVEPSEIQEQGRSYLDRLPEARGIYPVAAVLKNIQAFAHAQIMQFAQAGPDTLRLPCGSVEPFATQTDAAMAELAALAAHNQVVVVCQSESEKTRLTDLLHVKHPDVMDRVAMPVGDLAMGFRWQLADTLAAAASASPPASSSCDAVDDPPWLILLAHHEIFHRYHLKRRLRAIQGARPIDHFLDLQPGDYVVHVDHGIARYSGNTTLNRDGKSMEYLTLEFARSATLHVPIVQINLVQKYVGGSQGHPPLSTIGGGTWANQKNKVAEAVEKLAAEMLEVAAAREEFPGTAYPADTVWMREFENSFPFQATEDQLRCIEEIKVDLQKPRPMDRLLCGDVGYGKTELAIRSAVKVCESGKQVAVLAPTTVLVEQH